MVPHTVLIVDDEEEILTLLDIELSSEGYRVIKARSGTDAFKKAKDFLPQLVVLDILMPDLDGGQVLKLLKSTALTQNIPVIFLTAVLTKEEERTKHIGVTVDSTLYPAMAKPFNVQELLKEIGKIVHKNGKLV
jgi:two-component system alkaline phosphatase synthesis response regulator PhoP